MCLCLYVPGHISERIEFEYFESDSLPAQLKSLFKLSLFLPSQEFDSYKKWRKVCDLHYYVKTIVYCVVCFIYFMFSVFIFKGVVNQLFPKA